MAADSPIVIAYDGSPAAQAAIRSAGDLFAPRPAVVITVWEPGLGEMLLVPDPTGLGTMMPYDPGIAREIDREVESRAHELAREGATLARNAGLQASGRIAQDAGDVAEAILATAEEMQAGAIVVGSRGHHGLRSRLLGSTSAGVLKGAGRRPVLVVQHPGSDHGE